MLILNRKVITGADVKFSNELTIILKHGLDSNGSELFQYLLQTGKHMDRYSAYLRHDEKNKIVTTVRLISHGGSAVQTDDFKQVIDQLVQRA